MEFETSKTILSMEHLLRWKDNAYISYWLLHLGADPLKKDSSGDLSNELPKPLLASVALSPGRTPIDLINPLTSDPQAGAVGWKWTSKKWDKNCLDP